MMRRKLARVIQRKWYRFSLQTFRFTETCAGNAAPFEAEDKQAVSGLRPESFLNDKTESLRGKFSASGIGVRPSRF